MKQQERIIDPKQDPATAANRLFKEYFLNNSAESIQSYRETVAEVADRIGKQLLQQKQPYCGKSPESLKREIEKTDLFSAYGHSIETVLEKTRELAIGSNISVYHPHCVAHLHCPPFIASLAAEMIISAFNQSMDSWDQSPAATMIEQALCDQLCKFYGFGTNADATITGGGTMSNFMGILLARDHYSHKFLNWDIQKKGLPPEAAKFRILCSKQAHFTITQSASILGLGQEAVVAVNNEGFDESSLQLEQTIQQLKEDNLLPIVYVTTAGTTDFGSIGDISSLADCALRHDLWLHVDAAYGGALMFSTKHRHKLRGIDKADSVTIDFHKLLYQPISCGLFMVKNKDCFRYLRLHADYLNPESNMELGIVDLVYKSVQTTRRFDALKPFIALQHVGVEKIGEMIDYTIDLAQEVTGIIETMTAFELAYRTPINAIVFRYLPVSLGEGETDAINRSIKNKLLLSGEAIIGQTDIQGRLFLKFTLLNPMITLSNILELLDRITKLGKQLEQDFRTVQLGN